MSENYYPRHGEQSPSDEDIRIARLEDNLATCRMERVKLLAEMMDMKSRLEALQETNAATMRAIAEGQREACAERMRLAVDVNAEHLCRATPLVTEGDK